MDDIPRTGFIGNVVGGAEQLVCSAISLVLPVTVDRADVFHWARDRRDKYLRRGGERASTISWIINISFFLLSRIGCLAV